MQLVGTLDYSLIISATIAAIGAVTSAVVAAWVALQVRTPSGDTLGAVAERTHELAIVNALAVHKLNGHDDEPARPQPSEDVG